MSSVAADRSFVALELMCWLVLTGMWVLSGGTCTPLLPMFFAFALGPLQRGGNGCRANC